MKLKLFHTPTSPFVRKVLVFAHEVGVEVETVFLRPTPLAPDAALSKDNALSKIPVLVGPDGPLYDSPVICEYLDTLHGGRKLVPPSGPERFYVLRTQALCDGILDAGVLAYYERTMRPAELQWPAWLDGQARKARQALDALEADVSRFGAGEIDLAQICAGVTLGWLEFRDVLGDLRAGRPELFRWYERFRQRPSMRATEPHA